MTSPLEIFDAEIKKRTEKERDYLIGRYTKQVTQLEAEGIDIFAPCFGSDEMPHRQNIILTLKKLGWKMSHWSVTTHQNVAYAYPVFEKEIS